MKRRRSGKKNSKRKKSWTEQFKDYLRQFIAFLFSNVGIICLVCGYTIAGAFMFIAIEDQPPEKRTNIQAKMSYLRKNISRQLFEKVRQEYNPYNVNKTYFLDLMNKSLRRFQEKVIGEVETNDYDGETIYSDRWSMSVASLYCLTVITTIGYGNVVPRTSLGKFATIVYAIFGMPLFLLYLSNIGDLLAKSFKWLYAKICLCKMCRMRRKLHQNANANADHIPNRESWRMHSTRNKTENKNEEVGSEDEDTSESSDTSSSSTVSENLQEITVPITLCLAIMVGYISGGAMLFAGWEGLDFMDGSYFCFISLSTIGFGDIVPTSKITGEVSSIVQMNFIFCAIYLMLGMALIAMCFNLMQQEVVHKIRTCTNIVTHIAKCKT